MAVAQGKNLAKSPRAAVQGFFTLLKSQQYASLYDYLPSRLQQQVTPEQLAESLKRLGSYILIDRMEIGRVQQIGDFAVIDTTIYGLLKRPIEIDGVQVKEGRVSAQQYLFKENNRWRVVTADSRTRDFFLKENPQFNRQFQFSQPRFEFKQGDRWTPLIRAMRPGRQPNSIGYFIRPMVCCQERVLRRTANRALSRSLVSSSR